MEAFVALLAEKLGSLFDLTYHSLCPNKQPPIFGMHLPYLRQQCMKECFYNFYISSAQYCAKVLRIEKICKAIYLLECIYLLKINK